MNPFAYLLSKIPVPPVGQTHRAAAEFLADGAARFPEATFSPPADAYDTVLLLAAPSTTSARGRRVAKYLRTLSNGGSEA